jgi:hypothetical protein
VACAAYAVRRISNEDTAFSAKSSAKVFESYHKTIVAPANVSVMSVSSCGTSAGGVPAFGDTDAGYDLAPLSAAIVNDVVHDA